MTRAPTLGVLLCALAPTACDRHPSPNPPTLQTSKAEKAAVVFAKAVAEFRCPAPPGRFIIDDGTNCGPKQPVRTNCTIAYATCGAQLYTVFDRHSSDQVFGQRPSICIVEDACSEIKSRCCFGCFRYDGRCSLAGVLHSTRRVPNIKYAAQSPAYGVLNGNLRVQNQRCGVRNPETRCSKPRTWRFEHQSRRLELQTQRSQPGPWRSERQLVEFRTPRIQLGASFA